MESLLFRHALNDVPIIRLPGCALALALPYGNELLVARNAGVNLLCHSEEFAAATVRGSASPVP